MAESYIQNLFAERIGGKNYGKDTAIYKFEKIKRAKMAAKEANPTMDLIDMGVGEPDEMAYPIVIKTLQDEAQKPENRGYADNGGAEFKAAAKRYMENVFGVKGLNEQTEIIHSIGSKAALSITPACFINPGDTVIMTVPGYPVFGTHATYYGGEVYNLPLKEESNYLPDLDSITADVLKKAKVIVTNYPNNPTGANATLAFYEKLVKFAKDNKLIVLQDAAYASLVFEGKPVSFLEVEGAKDVGIELHSLSKSYNMTGWRIGFAVGNPLIIKAYGDLKDNTDSGQFLAIQKAGVTALDNPYITEEITTKYSRRMDLLIEALNQTGFQAKKPAGSFFLYTKAPKTAIGNNEEHTFSNGEDFSQWLIKELLISTVPWDDVDGYIRFSVTFAAKGENAEKAVVAEIKSRLSPYKFSF